MTSKDSPFVFEQRDAVAAGVDRDNDGIRMLDAFARELVRRPGVRRGLVAGRRKCRRRADKQAASPPTFHGDFSAFFRKRIVAEVVGASTVDVI